MHYLEGTRAAELQHLTPASCKYALNARACCQSCPAPSHTCTSCSHAGETRTPPQARMALLQVFASGLEHRATANQRENLYHIASHFVEPLSLQLTALVSHLEENLNHEFLRPGRHPWHDFVQVRVRVLLGLRPSSSETDMPWGFTRTCRT